MFFSNKIALFKRLKAKDNKHNMKEQQAITFYHHPFQQMKHFSKQKSICINLEGKKKR